MWGLALQTEMVIPASINQSLGSLVANLKACSDLRNFQKHWPGSFWPQGECYLNHRIDWEIPS